jgi:DNA mismatch repair protein MSH5
VDGVLRRACLRRHDARFTAPHLVVVLSVFNLISYYSRYPLTTDSRNMAPSHSGQKRRASGNAGSHARSASRTVQSSIRSGSRYTASSRRTSTDSLQGRGRKRAPARRASARSERPVSVASSRTFAGDVQSRATTEAPPDNLDADLDHLNEVVMAVHLTERGTVGCAYYVAREEKLYFMEDVKLGGSDIVDQCK